jgi:hypothetical protein
MRFAAGAPQAIARIPFSDTRELTSLQRRTVFAPPSPSAPTAQRGDTDVTLTWQATLPGASVQIYRNGRELAANASGEQFVERSMGDPGTVCYSLTQRFDDTGLASLSSREACVADPGVISATPGSGLIPSDGAAPQLIDGVAVFADWGRPSQELRWNFAPRASGWYRFALKYANAHGPVNTGITAAVKTVAVRCASEAQQSGSVAMPHLGEASPKGWSTGFFFQARGNEACELRIADGFNMSYLSHFARYTGGQGGLSGALNRADIAAAQVDLVRGARLQAP